MEDIPPTFISPAIDGTRSDSGAQTTEYVDVTTKDDPTWRMGINCGVRSLRFSLQGFVTDSALQALLTQRAMAGTIHEFELIDEISYHWKGQFQIASLERIGTYNGAEEISVTLESSGPFTSGVSCLATEGDDCLVLEDGSYLMPEQF